MLTVQCSELAIKKYSKVSYEIRRMDYQDGPFPYIMI